jgi:hypothetical protein
MAFLTDLLQPSGVLSLAGGTMTGTLLLNGTQTQPNAAATVGYLDQTSSLLTSSYSANTDITFDSAGRVTYFKSGDYQVANISYTTISPVAESEINSFVGLYVQQRVNSYTEIFGGYSQNVSINYNNTSTTITSVTTTVL